MGPFKRPSLGAGGRGFVFGPLVWQKTYHCPALQGGRPLSAELVDLATIASLQGHEEGHEEGGRPCRGGAPCQEGDEEGHEGQKVSEVAYLFCRRGFGLRRRNVLQVFLIFELASPRGGGRTRAFKLAVIRWRPFVGKGARARALSCFH